MDFTPVNRHLLVELIVEEKVDQPNVLLPEGYRAPDRFGCCKVLRVAEDCATQYKSGQILIINNSMVEELKIVGSTFYLILENHVLGITDV